MAKKISPKELVSFKELLMSEVIQSEALVNLLERKGIITKQEAFRVSLEDHGHNR